MSPDPLPDSSRFPSSIRFTERELELAHQMAALSLRWEPAPGMFLYDDKEHFVDPSPLQHGVYIILNMDVFTRVSGGFDRIAQDWTWLPTWEEGRAWLRVQGKSDAEILDRVRERVVDAGLSDREALYELMVATLRQQNEATA